MKEKEYYFKVDNTCIYCEDEHDSTHFLCLGCGTGMCDNCYDLMKEHDEHCFDFHESIEREDLYEIIKSSVGMDYGYMCYECIDRFNAKLL